MENLIVIGIVLAFVGVAIYYIREEKKKGSKCIGCPAAGCCGAKGCGNKKPLEQRGIENERDISKADGD